MDGPLGILLLVHHKTCCLILAYPRLSDQDERPREDDFVLDFSNFLNLLNIFQNFVKILKKNQNFKIYLRSEPCLTTGKWFTTYVKGYNLSVPPGPSRSLSSFRLLDFRHCIVSWEQIKQFFTNLKLSKLNLIVKNTKWPECSLHQNALYKQNSRACRKFGLTFWPQYG